MRNDCKTKTFDSVCFRGLDFPKLGLGKQNPVLNGILRSKDKLRERTINKRIHWTEFVVNVNTKKDMCTLNKEFYFFSRVVYTLHFVNHFFIIFCYHILFAIIISCIVFLKLFIFFFLRQISNWLKLFQGEKSFVSNKYSYFSL